MSKNWLFNFLCVLMISLPSHCMNFVFNMGSETRLMRNIRNASEFLNKNGWTMFITGTAVATLCCYDKPVMWHAGVVGFNGLLMYKFIQMQKQMNALVQQLEETNNKVIQQNGVFQKTLDDIKKEQEEQKNGLQQANQNIGGILPKVNACEKSITEKLTNFNKENVDPLRADVGITNTMLRELQKDLVGQCERQTALGNNIDALRALSTNIRQKQENMVVEHTKKFTAIEAKIETRFNELDTFIATSLGEIKERLKQRGVVWQDQKSIGFGRRAAGGLISPLSSVIKSHSSNSSIP